MSNPHSDPNRPADVLIVGGGSAGATLAARLSEDPNRRVLLLEAGPAFTPDEVPPELSNAEHVAAPTFDWGYTARGGSLTAEMAVPRGRVLGGSSAVNAAVAIRARRQDVESWQIHGVEGWAWDVLFDGTTATGVISSTNEVYPANEVILSAGTYGSAAILLRSGVGPARDLAELGIGTIADLPVGQHLQDQPIFYNAYALSNNALQMSPAVGALLWFRSSLATDGDLDLHISATHLVDGALSPTGGAIVLATAVVLPESVGTLRISSTDPNAAPLIDNNFLATERDQLRMLEALKLSRRLARSPVFGPLQAGELTPGDAVRDEALPEVIAANLATYGHPTSTVPMGDATDPAAVVDSVGVVRGLHNLRVVDASVIPHVPSTVTNLTTIMVAEHIYRRAYAR
jgi:choline dehydrogenase-like flavoprotein